MSASFPPLAELVPHAGPMRLLGRVLAHAPDETLCEVDPEGSVLFAGDDGRVPAWLALEYMAQCAAVHGGLAARAAGAAPAAGLLLGCRELRLHASTLDPRAGLRVWVRPGRSGRSGLRHFACALESEGAPLAEGELRVLVLPAGPGSPGAAA